MGYTRASLHKWEEPCISGYPDSPDVKDDRDIVGSGTVFFAGCNLHCCFCQNYEISRGSVGTVADTVRLADIFLNLRDRGAHNINLVTPTHYVPQIIEALDTAKSRGLDIPVVYNSGGYESSETVRRLKDYIDIWMPDMKYMSTELSSRYSNAPDYFDRASEALRTMTECIRERFGGKMYLFDEHGIMQHGVLVRHMTLPGQTGDSKRILRYLHNTFGDDIFISIMSQYTPMKHNLKSSEFPELQRRVTEEEYDRLIRFAEKIGITNAYIQNGETALESFIPAFDGTGL